MSGTQPMTDTRNVIDYFKYWSTEAIKAELDTRRHNFSVLVSNLINDFNLGNVIRNANAFLAKEVLIYGRKQYDRRGTVGTHHYENIKFLRKIEEVIFPEDYVIVAIENTPEAVPIEDFLWPQDRHVIMIFGQENEGVSPELLALADHVVYIRQYGSVRSLNVGTASGIAMYSYCSKLQTLH